jgi:hypothetical protein
MRKRQKIAAFLFLGVILAYNLVWQFYKIKIQNKVDGLMVSAKKTDMDFSCKQDNDCMVIPVNTSCCTQPAFFAVNLSNPAEKVVGFAYGGAKSDGFCQLVECRYNLFRFEFDARAVCRKEACDVRLMRR